MFHDKDHLYKVIHTFYLSDAVHKPRLPMSHSHRL